MKFKISSGVLILIIAIGCNSNIENNKTVKANKTQLTSLQELKRESDFISRLNYKVYVDLSVTSISIDSILVKITLFNDSNKIITLFKPALPIGRPAGNIFLIEYSNSTFSPILFTDTANTFKYTKDTKPSSFFFRVIPEVYQENIIQVKPHQQINFSINIARHYDFKNLYKKGIKDFDIGYAVYMPVIENNKHIYEESFPNNTKKPVYAIIGSGIVGNGTIKKIKFKVQN